MSFYSKLVGLRNTIGMLLLHDTFYTVTFTFNEILIENRKDEVYVNGKKGMRDSCSKFILEHFWVLFLWNGHSGIRALLRYCSIGGNACMLRESCTHGFCRFSCFRTPIKSIDPQRSVNSIPQLEEFASWCDNAIANKDAHITILLTTH